MTRRLRRIAFFIYAAALFIGTHIPNLRIHVGEIDRPDLFVHMTAFGGWFGLLLASEFLGPWRSIRSVGYCAMISVITAGIDEYSQSIPALNRTAAWDDFGANVTGIALAAVIAAALARLFRTGNQKHEPASPA